MFKKILIPLDHSPLAEQAIGRAAAIARAHGAEIDLMLVREPFPFAGYADMPWAKDDSTYDQAYLDAIAAELRSGAAVAVTSAVMRGAATEMIGVRARDVGADLIVMTSHGRTGLSRAWLGSVADAVVHRSTIPVLMLRAAETPSERMQAAVPFKHVLVPHDGSAFAADVLPTAIDLARANDARLTLLRVAPHVPLPMVVEPALPLAFLPIVPDDATTAQMVERMTHELRETARRIQERDQVDVSAEVVVNERTAEAIVAFARGHDVDAIAMSTHGRGASRWLLGSVADKVLRASQVPVLLRRPSGVREDMRLSEESIVEQLPALAGS